MPRQARLDIPGALHHIMVRGINKSAIFADDEDKSRFLQRLSENVTKAGASVYAWVLMDTHAHILFKSGELGISSVMRKLLTWYAQYYNRRHKRTGHLFENRYKSILCDEDNYLLALVRYIHLNPIRANIITTMEQLDDYKWSGHRQLLENADCSWMDTAYILSQFAGSLRKAKAAYQSFVSEGLKMGNIPELTGGGLVRSKGGWSQVLAMRCRGEKEEYDERILGSSDFVNAVLLDVEARQLRQLKHRTGGNTIGKIIEEECKQRQISLQELKSGAKRREVSDTRAIIAWRSREELGLLSSEIARYLGVNTSCIVRSIDRAAQRFNGKRHV
jgi:REP element-mobilizing transposase RayT